MPLVFLMPLEYLRNYTVPNLFALKIHVYDFAGDVFSSTMTDSYFIRTAMSLKGWLMAHKALLGVLFTGMLLVLTGCAIAAFVMEKKGDDQLSSYEANVVELTEMTPPSSSTSISTVTLLADVEASPSSSTIPLVDPKEKKVLFAIGSPLSIETVTTLTATPALVNTIKGITSLDVNTESSAYSVLTAKEVIPLVATPLQGKEGRATRTAVLKAKEVSPSSSISSLTSPEKVSIMLFLKPDEKSLSSSTEHLAPSTTSSENLDQDSPSIPSSIIAPSSQPLKEKSEEVVPLTSSSISLSSVTTAPSTSEPLQEKIEEEVPLTSTASEVSNPWRLPKPVIPESYDLYLYPDLETGLFKGSVSIKVDIKRNCKEIRLHSNGLELDSVNVDGKMANFKLDRKHELVIISFENGKNFAEDVKILDVQYHGNMKDRIIGLYTSVYMDETNTKRTIICSKFEPTYARKAFPCFDEPQLKAEYTIHILKPKDPKYICLSNMPEEGNPTDLHDGYLVNFKRSVKMSTYLLCFIVCDFEFTETYFKNLRGEKIPLRVYSTPAQVQKTKYALTEAKGVMEYFLEYFQADYPLPKLDLIGIPEFCAGAMEHWGLVTFRETELLFDQNKSSVTTKETIARVVAHELAHIWFGNLGLCIFRYLVKPHMPFCKSP